LADVWKENILEDLEERLLEYEIVRRSFGEEMRKWSR